jgi:hypothetical protein
LGFASQFQNMKQPQFLFGLTKMHQREWRPIPRHPNSTHAGRIISPYAQYLIVILVPRGASSLRGFALATPVQIPTVQAFAPREGLSFCPATPSDIVTKIKTIW